ncbi:MAG: type IV toxin-antitoxin system AbiEi family antitoxin [Bacteroidales bacterium]|nr:type IV toxin-antitoxin system AbiEi family antitoxin [Bacteroidales bacterium]
MNVVTKHTVDFIRDFKSNGKLAFTVDDLYNSVPKSKKNLRKDLDRLRDRGEIINIRRGFYTIIPDGYRNMGTLPVELYADDLMKYLQKKYYVGLFSAAMLHGAAHQQPQEYFIVTEAPKLRNVKKEKFIINFSEKRKFPVYGIEKKKTDTGYLKLSNKELTLFDLIYYEKNLGGFNRIITILDELIEEIKIGNFKEVVKNEFPLTVYQRAGYILEHIYHDEKLSNIIEKRLLKEKTRVTLLNSSGKKIGNVDKKWKVQVNIEIASEL